jgi:hypothetical protein
MLVRSRAMREAKRVAFVLSALLSLTAAASGAGGQAANPAASEPETSTTRVAGNLPVDLRGVWLVTVAGQYGGDGTKMTRNFAELWAIESSGGDLAVSLVQRHLPDVVRQEMQRADAEGRAWAPSPSVLADLAREMDRLPPADPQTFLRHEYKLATPEHYAAELDRSAAAAEGSAFAVLVKHVYRPRTDQPHGAQLMSDDAVYAVEKVDSTRLDGKVSRVILAAAFVPVPVRADGPFVMYRLRGPDGAAPAAPGLWARLAEALGSLFRGCR